MQVKHRTRPEHGEQTRTHLLALARAMFAEQGHAGVALQELCERAGVTRGALYHHFPNKDALFAAVCEEVAGDVSRAVTGRARRHSAPADRLAAGCEAFLDACTRPDVRRILLTDGPSVLGWQAFRDIDARHGLGLLTTALGTAVAEGTIAAVPVEATAHMLAAALNEAAMLIGTAPDPDRARNEAHQAIHRLLSGLASPPTPNANPAADQR
jgi:AcrR family transcriptional regulator